MRSREDITSAVEAYADTVLRACAVYLRERADREDAFQETFLRYARNDMAFENEEHRKAWLIRVAMHECVSYLRKNRRVLTIKPQREESVPFDFDRSDMSWALFKTPAKYREVLYLYYCEQYKVKEIAIILQKKENTVKSLLKRGREILRSIYGGERNE